MLDEAWMAGVLAGIEDATGFDMRRCEYFVGTSAGSLLAARLAAGQAPARPPTVVPTARQAPSEGAAPVRLARRTAAWALALGSPLAPATLGMIEPGGALARAIVLRVIPEPTDTPVRVREALARIKAVFDGRLRIVAVERRRGRRTVFGQPGAPVATVAEAVEASCAIPWLYAPVRIAGRAYVDGSFWSPTNLDVAPAHRGTHVLCLNPIAGLPGPHPALTLARESSRARMLLESQSLRGQGALVRLVSPDASSVRELSRPTRARAPDVRALTAGYRQGLTLTEC
jgi:NTE family protein